MKGNDNINTILRLFSQLPPSEQMEVAEKINERTFQERWEQLDKELPDKEVSEEEIIKELRLVRYGKKNHD